MSAPNNPGLVRAIQEVLDAPQSDLERYFRPVLDQILASTLVVGNDGDFSTIEGDDDELLLALFTDLIELHMFDPGCPWVEMRGEDAIRRIAAEEYDGLVINPRGKQFRLSREDVVELFEIDD